MKLQNARVMVTGGAGLIGSHIVDLLVQEPVQEILIVDSLVRGRVANLGASLNDPRVKLIEADVRDAARIHELMQGINLVFHQAALRITQCAEDPRLAFDILGGGSFNVISAASEAGVEKLIAASTASIYGLAEKFPTREDHHPYNNRTIYGALKVLNEGLLRSFNDMYGLNYVALRYFNVYGPRMDIHGAFTEVFIRWMERIEAGLQPLIFGDGMQTMDFVYVTDIARANLLAAKSDVTDRVFNVASGNETSLNDLANGLVRAMGRTMKVEYREERKVNPVRRRLASTAAARIALGFETTIGLDLGLATLVAWWRAERAADAALKQTELPLV